MPLLAIYAVGLAYVITGGSAAACNPRRFWLALALYPVVAIPGLGNYLLNRM